MSEDKITIVTKDNEVEARGAIRVRVERVSTETQELTLAQIDQSIADLTRQRDEIASGLARMLALRSSIAPSADAVALKVRVEPPAAELVTETKG